MGNVEVHNAFEPQDELYDGCSAVFEINFTDGSAFKVDITLSQEENNLPELTIRTWQVKSVDSSSEGKEVTMTTRVEKHVHQSFKWIASKWSETGSEVT